MSREIISTRLRYVTARKAETICNFVSNLPFKIEIKGGLVFDGKKWLLSFVIPDSILREPRFGDLDRR